MKREAKNPVAFPTKPQSSYIPGVTTMLIKFIRDEEGATAIEYGLIASLIAVVIIAAVALVGSNLNDTFQEVADHI
jgi:pilus assembly protein Flp/PilA